MLSVVDKQGLTLLFYACLTGVLLLSGVTMALADETEHRLGPGVTVAAGIGFDVTYGDYGNGADATAVTLPVTVAINPAETVDVTLQIPLVYQTGRVGNRIAGGTGPRRNVPNTPLGGTAVIVSEAGLGDINLLSGWVFAQEGDLIPRLRATAYLKFPSGDKNRGLGTGTFEAGPGLSVSKWFGGIQLFIDGSYVFQDHADYYQGKRRGKSKGKNYLYYSAGGGLQATDRLFVSLYAKGSSARSDGGIAPVEGRLKVNFLQSRRVSWEVYGLTGFTNASPMVGGGLLVLYQF